MLISKLYEQTHSSTIIKMTQIIQVHLTILQTILMQRNSIDIYYPSFLLF